LVFGIVLLEDGGHTGEELLGPLSVWMILAVLVPDGVEAVVTTRGTTGHGNPQGVPGEEVMDITKEGQSPGSIRPVR
jgi:hypothetical protein